MHEIIYSQKKLNMADVDIAGRWRISSILLDMQEMGDLHAIDFDANRAKLLEHDMVWVVSRVSLNMRRYPILDEEVVHSTWLTDIRAPFFHRCFRFCSPEGEMYGECMTLWILFDIKKRKLVLPSGYPGKYLINKDVLPKTPVPAKIKTAGIVNPSIVRPVRYSDIDHNGHMNNARYADWICDMFPVEKFRDQFIRQLQINYISECRPTEDVSLGIKEDLNEFLISGAGQYGRDIFSAHGFFN